METIDLGLSSEEDAVNNKSARDPINFHQHASIGKSNNNRDGKDKNQKEVGDKVIDVESDSENSNSESDNKKRRKLDLETVETQGPRLTTNVSQTSGHYSSYVARPVLTMKGHTAFLTFAIRSLTD